MLFANDFYIDFAGRFYSDSHMAVVYIDINRVSKGCNLQHLHTIARQASHFKKLKGNSVNIKIEDERLLANF